MINLYNEKNIRLRIYYMIVELYSIIDSLIHIFSLGFLRTHMSTNIMIKFSKMFIFKK